MCEIEQLERSNGNSRMYLFLHWSLRSLIIAGSNQSKNSIQKQNPKPIQRNHTYQMQKASPAGISQSRISKIIVITISQYA